MDHPFHGADLHLHTIFSDGLYAPEALVATARERLLEWVAVTDHDTVSGVAATRQAARGTGVNVIAGVELGAPGDLAELHIVGLFIDISAPSLVSALDRIRAGRKARMAESVRRLGRLGIHISLAELIESAAPAVPGRAHLARALVRSKAVPTFRAAFQRFIGNGMPAHAPRTFPSVPEAIAIIHAAGGLAVYAHPLLTNRDELIPDFVDAGLDAIEAVHPYHSPSVERRYRRICAGHEILASGGSDCHGHEPGQMGNARLCREDFARLQEAAATRPSPISSF